MALFYCYVWLADIIRKCIPPIIHSSYRLHGTNDMTWRAYKLRREYCMYVFEYGVLSAIWYVPTYIYLYTLPPNPTRNSRFNSEPRVLHSTLQNERGRSRKHLVLVFCMVLWYIHVFADVWDWSHTQAVFNPSSTFTNPSVVDLKMCFPNAHWTVRPKTIFYVS